MNRDLTTNTNDELVGRVDNQVHKKSIGGNARLVKGITRVDGTLAGYYDIKTGETFILPSHRPTKREKEEEKHSFISKLTKMFSLK